MWTGRPHSFHPAWSDSRCTAGLCLPFFPSFPSAGGGSSCFACGELCGFGLPIRYDSFARFLLCKGRLNSSLVFKYSCRGQFCKCVVAVAFCALVRRHAWGKHGGVDSSSVESIVQKYISAAPAAALYPSLVHFLCWMDGCYAYA